jgi:hypothetical protein
MAHGDAREGKWRRNWRMEWGTSTLHITSERGVSSITTAEAHTSVANSRLNWRPRRFKWARPFLRKTKSGFCAYAVTVQQQSTSYYSSRALLWRLNVAGNSKAYVVPHVQCPIFPPDFNQIRLFSTYFHKPVSIKFHLNPSTGSRNDTCEQTDGHDEHNRRFSRSCERALKSSISTPLLMTENG